MIVFAGGLLGTAIIVSLAALSYLPDRDETNPLIVLTALSLFLAGAGQFVAAFRGPQTYAATLACAAGSVFFLAATLLKGTEIAAGHDLGPDTPQLLLAVGSVVMAVGSLVIAAFFPFGYRQAKPPSPQH